MSYPSDLSFVEKLETSLSAPPARERRLEFAVIGDTVNVASRAERLTRELHVDLVASDDLVRTVRNDGESAALCEGLDEAPPQAIRGREESVPVWTMSFA